MDGPLARVELRPRRGLLVSAVAGGVGLVAVAIWLGGLAGWLTGTAAIAFAAVAGYQMLRWRPRLVLTASGIEWGGRQLQWNEVASMREVSWRTGLARFRLLGIDTLGHKRRSRSDPALFGVDYSINVRGLDRSADDVFELVEAYSGRKVARRA